MNGWFVTYLALNFMSLGIHLAKHGEPREGNYSFWTALIGCAIQIVIIYMAVKNGF